MNQRKSFEITLAVVLSMLHRKITGGVKTEEQINSLTRGK